MTTLLNALRYDLSFWRVCSWCSKTIMPGNPANGVSHGICKACAEKWGA